MSCEKRNCSGTSTCDRLDGKCDKGCLKGWELPDCVTGMYRLLKATVLLIFITDSINYVYNVHYTIPESVTNFVLVC